MSGEADGLPHVTGPGNSVLTLTQDYREWERGWDAVCIIVECLGVRGSHL